MGGGLNPGGPCPDPISRACAWLLGPPAAHKLCFRIWPLVSCCEALPGVWKSWASVCRALSWHPTGLEDGRSSGPLLHVLETSRALGQPGSWGERDASLSQGIQGEFSKRVT